MKLKRPFLTIKLLKTFSIKKPNVLSRPIEEEYLLLKYFMQNPNRVLSRRTLLENVWDMNFDTNTNVVDVYVNYIRNKIQPEGTDKLLHTVIGLGYILKEE